MMANKKGSSFTFDSFEVNDTNRKAFEKAKQFAEKADSKPLAIFGGTATGKTHLLYAVKKEIEKYSPELDVIITTTTDMASSLIRSITSCGSKDVFIEKYMKADVLLVDDIQELAGKEATQQALICIFNKFCESGKRFMMTYSVRDSQPGINERLVSRLFCGEYAVISEPYTYIQLSSDDEDAGISERIKIMISGPESLPTEKSFLIQDGTQVIDKKYLSDHSHSLATATNIYIPASVQSIDADLYFDLMKVKDVTVSSDNKYYYINDGVLYSAEQQKLIICPVGKEKLIIPEGVSGVCEGALSWCDELRNISVPSTLNDIKPLIKHSSDELSEISIAINNPLYTSIDGVVYNKSITELVFCPPKRSKIIIPDTVRIIASQAFRSCHELEEIVLPEGLTRIGERAFLGCKKLKKLRLPQSVKCIESKAFLGCDSLSEIIADEKNQSYSSKDGVLYTKGYSKLIYCNTNNESLCIPEGVKDIEAYSFGKCAGLRRLCIPASAENINTVFVFCEDLAEICIDENNKSYISFDGVMYDKALKTLIRCPKQKETVDIPETVTAIGDHAFSKCKRLEEIILPDKLESIGKEAFFSCKGLQRLVLPASLKCIDGLAFFRCDGLKAISIPDSVDRLCCTAFRLCSNLEEINVSQNNPVYTSYDGALYIKGTNELIYCPEAKKSITIPEGTKRIKDRAFLRCNDIETLYIPDSVEKLDSYFIEYCKGLKCISLPSRLAVSALETITCNQINIFVSGE